MIDSRPSCSLPDLPLLGTVTLTFWSQGRVTARFVGVVLSRVAYTGFASMLLTPRGDLVLQNEHHQVSRTDGRPVSFDQKSRMVEHLEAVLARAGAGRLPQVSAALREAARVDAEIELEAAQDALDRAREAVREAEQRVARARSAREAADA